VRALSALTFSHYLGGQCNNAIAPLLWELESAQTV